MDAGVGDRIVVESEQAAHSGRAGVIEDSGAHTRDIGRCLFVLGGQFFAL
jgi:hypothetical protein